MTQRLTDEQIQKANDFGGRVLISPRGYDFWCHVAEILQYPTQPVNGDLVLAMLDAFYLTRKKGIISPLKERKDCMSAALRVAADAMLESPTKAEIDLAESRRETVPMDQILRSFVFARNTKFFAKPAPTLKDQIRSILIDRFGTVTNSTAYDETVIKLVALIEPKEKHE